MQLIVENTLVSLLLILKIFHTLFKCFYCYLWASKWELVYVEKLKSQQVRFCPQEKTDLTIRSRLPLSCSWQMQLAWINAEIYHVCLRVCKFVLFCIGQTLLPSLHTNVVTTFSQRLCWRCHNVVSRWTMRVIPTSFSDVVTTSLFDAVKTLTKRCYNVVTTLSIWFLGHFITDCSDFFPVIEAWESCKSTKWH